MSPDPISPLPPDASLRSAAELSDVLTPALTVTPAIFAACFWYTSGDGSTFAGQIATWLNSFAKVDAIVTHPIGEKGCLVIIKTS